VQRVSRHRYLYAWFSTSDATGNDGSIQISSKVPPRTLHFHLTRIKIVTENMSPGYLVSGAHETIEVSTTKDDRMQTSRLRGDSGLARLARRAVDVLDGTFRWRCTAHRDARRILEMRLCLGCRHGRGATRFNGYRFVGWGCAEGFESRCWRRFYMGRRW